MRSNQGGTHDFMTLHISLLRVAAIVQSQLVRDLELNEAMLSQSLTQHTLA